MQHLLFGHGRVGKSVAAYARSKGVDVKVVSRQEADSLFGDAVEREVLTTDIVLIATPDDTIAPIVRRLEGVFDKAPESLDTGPKRPAIIHFSGAMVVEGAASLHPLYSFPPSGLDPQAMERIPFAIEPGGPTPSDVFPGAENAFFEVPREKRAAYHAMAVLVANFAAHIWNDTAATFAQTFPDAPDDALAMLVDSCADRFREAPTDSMTGPVARRDWETVAANLEALNDHPSLLNLYTAFLTAAWPGYLEKEHAEKKSP